MKALPKINSRRFRMLVMAACVLVVGGLFIAAAHPNTTVQAFLGAAMALTILWIYLQFRTQTITTLADAPGRTGIHILAVVPALTPKMLRALPPDDRSAHGFLTDQPASAFSRGFRTLSQHLVSDREGAARVIAINPVLGGDGGTTTSLCVAQSLALRGVVRTLVIDCDLRRRDLTRALGLRPDAGISEVVAGQVNWRAVVRSAQGRGFDVLPAKDNALPARDLFSQERFRALLADLRRSYDLVVLDCPPVFGSVEGRMLAREADGCVLIVRWAHTPLKAIRSARNALQRIGANKVAGLFVTEAPRAAA